MCLRMVIWGGELPGTPAGSRRQPSGHDADHGPLDHRLGVRGQPLVVVVEPGATHDPREGPLYDPPAGQRLEAALALLLADHLDDQTQHLADFADGARALTDWASTIPAEAIGSRPVPSRTQSRSASWQRSTIPSSCQRQRCQNTVAQGGQSTGRSPAQPVRST